MAFGVAIFMFFSHGVDSSKGPPRKNRQKIHCFFIFPVHGKNGLRWPQIGPGGFFPTNPDLADILGRTDLDFDNFHFFHFLDPKFLDFQVPRSPNFWISRPPDLQIPRFPGSQISDAAAGRILRSQLDPSPNAPRDQIRRKEPLLQQATPLSQRSHRCGNST